MPTPITFTFDLEDHRPHSDAWPSRYPDLTRALLGWLDERAITATVFIVGTLASEAPDLVNEIAERGHEIGLHNWHHVALTSQTPRSFREGVRRGKALLEELTGRTVAGFRAPTGSLVPNTLWAVDVLAEEGFSYSSSVVPGRNPLHSFPGAPTHPFRHQSGLAEFPAPMSGPKWCALPFLGGTYLRLIPQRVHDAMARSAPIEPGAFLYCHPYDFDTDERFWWVGDVGPLSPLLWIGRRGLLAKLDHLMAMGSAPPLGNLLDLADRGGIWSPTNPARHALARHTGRRPGTGGHATMARPAPSRLGSPATK